MLATLGVREVGAIVLVDGETETAFVGADVILEEEGVFAEVDGLHGELAQALAPVGVGAGRGGYASAAEFGACSVLKLGS
jgi:hypothetical protein